MTRVFSHLYVFRVYNNHSNNFTDRIFIGEVFQIEVSDVVDLVHPLEIMQRHLIPLAGIPYGAADPNK